MLVPNPDKFENATTRRDLPEALVNGALDQQQSEIIKRFAEENWHELQKRPNLQRFIASVSFEVAPEDPEKRGKVTTAMLGLLSLLETAESYETLELIYGMNEAEEPQIPPNGDTEY